MYTAEELSGVTGFDRLLRIFRSWGDQLTSLSTSSGRHPVRAGLALAILGLGLCSLAFPAEFVQFTIRRDQDSADLLGDGHVLLRLRTGMTTTPDLEAVAAGLKAAALAGARGGDFTAQATAESGKIFVRGQLLISLDKRTAQISANTPKGLATSWLRNLQRLFDTAYVCLDAPDRLLVPVGEQRTVSYGGPGANQLKVSSLAPDVATVKLVPAEHTIAVQGLQKGTTVLSADLPGTRSQLLTLDVKYWAAQAPAAVVAQVSAPPLPDDDNRRLLRNAVLCNAKPMPGATLALTEPTGGPDVFSLGLSATGPDLIPYSQTVKVTLAKTSAPPQPSRELLVSNLPERITAPATLLRESLSGTFPVRLLWHHVNSSPNPVRFVIRVANRSTESASVHLTDSASGPANDEIFVGHSAMVRFLKLWEQGEGYVLEVPPGRMLELYDVRLQPDAIVSGLAHITPLVARDLLVEVVAESIWPTDAYFPPVPDRLLDDPPLTPYRFEAEKSLSVSHEVGGPWTFYHVGKDYSENLQGQKLMGDYGVLYRIKASFRNPTAQPARCEIGLRASGGVARATVIINGEMIETGVLQGAREQVIYKVTLQPGEEKQLALRTVPESGSNYPITLMLRSWQ